MTTETPTSLRIFIETARLYNVHVGSPPADCAPEAPCAQCLTLAVKLARAAEDRLEVLPAPPVQTTLVSAFPIDVVATCTRCGRAQSCQHWEHPVQLREPSDRGREFEFYERSFFLPRGWKVGSAGLAGSWFGTVRSLLCGACAVEVVERAP